MILLKTTPKKNFSEYNFHTPVIFFFIFHILFVLYNILLEHFVCNLSFLSSTFYRFATSTVSAGF